jgi:hypothetical protein
MVYVPASDGAPAKACFDAGGADQFSGWRCMLLVLRVLHRCEGVVTALGLPRDHQALLRLFREERSRAGDATDEEVRVFCDLVRKSCRASGRQSAVLADVSLERIRARRNAATAVEPPKRWAICVPKCAHDAHGMQPFLLTAAINPYEEKSPSWALPILLQEGFQVQGARTEDFAEFAARRRVCGRDG